MKAAPFSEPREWQDCDWCQGDFWHRYFNGGDPEDAFAPCPVCGQPPRCRVGSATEDRHCPRPATMAMFRHDTADLCGQHYRDSDVLNQRDDWRHAREFIGMLCKQAELTELGALVEAMNLAWAEAEMRIESLEAEHRAIWDGDSRGR